MIGRVEFKITQTERRENGTHSLKEEQVRRAEGEDSRKMGACVGLLLCEKNGVKKFERDEWQNVRD